MELYKWKNRGQVHEIYKMVELKKWHASTIENPYNLGTYHIIKVPSVLHSAHVVSKD